MRNFETWLRRKLNEFFLYWQSFIIYIIYIFDTVFGPQEVKAQPCEDNFDRYGSNRPAFD